MPGSMPRQVRPFCDPWSRVGRSSFRGLRYCPGPGLPLPECRLGSLVELSLLDCGDGNLQILASSADGVAEEFAFCGVNQRMRGENFFERRQGAA